MNTLLDLVYPLNESRPKQLPVNGDICPFDVYEHHFKIYFIYTTIAATTIGVFLGVDNMYVAVDHQDLGFFRVVRYILNKAVNCYIENKVLGYNRIISAIRMHSETLQYLASVEASYGICYFLIVSFSAVILSFSAMLTLEAMEQFNVSGFLTFSVSGRGVALHLFYTSWPDEKAIDHSNELFMYICRCKWYTVDKRGKALTRFKILRCEKPCKLTTCGIYTMCFESLVTVIKTTISFITALTSFKK